MREFPLRKIKETSRAALVVRNRVRAVAQQDVLPFKFKYQALSTSMPSVISLRDKDSETFVNAK